MSTKTMMSATPTSNKSRGMLITTGQVHLPELKPGGGRVNEEELEELDDVTHEQLLRLTSGASKRTILPAIGSPVATATVKSSSDASDKLRKTSHFVAQSTSRRNGSVSMEVTAAHRSPSPRKASVFSVAREYTFTSHATNEGSRAEEPVSSDEIERRRYTDVYRQACRRLGVIPATSILSRLMSKDVRLCKRGLGPKGARALAITFVENVRVQTLDLTGNDIGSEGARCIAQMLKGNPHITNLNLSENQIKSAGIEALCNALKDREDFNKLDLSSNQIHSCDCPSIAGLIEGTTALRELRLSHNAITEDGASDLGRAIASNESIEILDLSWNHIRGSGAEAIALGLAENNTLRLLNVSWNGFGREGCAALMHALSRNNTLRELDLRCNRIYNEGMGYLLKGLQQNATLCRLRLSMNPIDPPGAVIILQALIEMPNVGLRELDMSDIVVNPKFTRLLRELSKKVLIYVNHGVEIRYSKSPQETEGLDPHLSDPRSYIFKMLEKDQLRVVDLFNRMDTDKSHSLDREEFKEAVSKAKLDITNGQLDRLIDMIDADDNGEIDLGELLRAERAYNRAKIMFRKREQARIAAVTNKGKREKLEATMTCTEPPEADSSDTLTKQLSKSEEALGDVMLETLGPIQHQLDAAAEEMGLGEGYQDS